MNKESRMFQTTLLVNKYIFFITVLKHPPKKLKYPIEITTRVNIPGGAKKMALSLDKHQIPLTLSLPRSDC